MTRWIVSAAGYCSTTCSTMRANSAPQRLGVAVVKCRPPFGSTTPNTLAVPHRLYSLVHDEVDRVSGGVLFHDVLHHACELGTATVGSSGGEVPAAWWS